MDEQVKFIDLFAGIGGFHQAFNNLGAKCVFASEWDRYARLTYEMNYKQLEPELFESGNFVGDITLVDPRSIPDFDVLTGGFPCQPFSQAGKKLGFGETRGTLFFNVEQILSIKKPRAFFLENVRGLLSHDGGRTMKVIEKHIGDLGYSFYYQIIKASDYGLPTHRPRLYMIGFRDKSIHFEFPEPLPLKMTLSDIFKGECNKQIGYTLRVGGKGSGLGDRRNWDSYLVNGQHHRITVDEARELMGFPGDFVFPVSKAQAMKQLGNSVAVDAIRATASELIKALSLHPKRTQARDEASLYAARLITA